MISADCVHVQLDQTVNLLDSRIFEGNYLVKSAYQVDICGATRRYRSLFELFYIVSPLSDFEFWDMTNAHTQAMKNSPTQR